MARQLRIEYSGALYHITSRGNAKGSIFLSDRDRKNFLSILGQVIDCYGWKCYAYCLMNNHYHLLIETPNPNLSIGMRQLNGVYTQSFNRMNEKTGHLFQGRFKSFVVEKENYLLALCAYIVLNPVRAKIVKDAIMWPWSSYRANIGIEPAPKWLNVEHILGMFGNSIKEAAQSYRKFLDDQLGQKPPVDNVIGRVFIGGKDFVDGIMKNTGKKHNITEIPKEQRLADRKELEEIFANTNSIRERNKRMREARNIYGYRQSEISKHLGLHYVTVSRVLKKF